MKTFLSTFGLLLLLAGCQNRSITPDRVRPAPRQIDYQQQERIAFVHFGINTFTNREWGTGKENPRLFNPAEFDAEQWARVLSETGFETLILTAKHHDGFALWPSEFTDHDIAASPWKNGNGDIVKEVSEASQKYGLKFGIYLSPWDMHEPTYGTEEYNQFYMNQLRELLTNYGPIAEVWFDGAKGENAKDMEYEFEAWWNLVRELQPQAVIFSDEGPDVRWIGNEHGFAGETNWSKVDRDSITIGKAGLGPYLNTGEPQGDDWVVGECDVSIRPGWFYHPEEDDEVKTVDELMEIYHKSVGRNCTMLLNIPPQPNGRFHPTDVQRLKDFHRRLQREFSNDLAGSINGSGLTDKNWETYWTPSGTDTTGNVTLHFDEPVTFDRLVLQEYIQIGQRIASFRIETSGGKGWTELARGTTIGYKRILLTPETTTKKLKLVIDHSYGRPAISNLSLFLSTK